MKELFNFGYENRACEFECNNQDYISTKRAAFTMAEILISLTIIGVIAAITLPSLRANINESAWATQRKALYSRMSQAIAMMPSLNGYGIGATDAETASKAAQAFITDGLSKVLKINNICDSENLSKCGFSDKIAMFQTNSKIVTPKVLTDLSIFFNINWPNIKYSQINTNTAAFETANGESVLTFYNPNCSYNYGINSANGSKNIIQPTMCANFIYDLNGRKGPNKVGKDIGFITAFYPTDSVVVAPYPTKATKSVPGINAARNYCHNLTTQSRLPNIEELGSFSVNILLLNDYGTAYGYLSSKIKDNKCYVVALGQGLVWKMDCDNATSPYVICVKRD